MRPRTWLVLIGLTMLFTGSHVRMTRSVVRQIHATALPAIEGTTSILGSATSALPAPDEDWDEPRIDLNGNEIDAAIGDYRVDVRGEMYERHAPDTALLHLSAPEL